MPRILLGDDRLDFARANFPMIPGAEVDYVATPQELLEHARTGNYDIIITDLNYSENGEEGYMVLEELENYSGRKILWTGNAYDQGVRERGEALGAEVLDKNELGTLVGQVVNNAPIAQDGKVLIYARDLTGKAFHNVLETMLGDRMVDVVVSSELEKELATGAYGLVIDTSTLLPDHKSTHGTVAHDMKYMRLSQVPRVVTVPDLFTAVPDITRTILEYLE